MSDVIETLNKEAIKLLNSDNPLQAEQLLTKAQNMLEFTANCGKAIDRNLIITILYNQASVQQVLWDLKKCANYLDAVIYNVEAITNNESNQILFIKRLYFLATVKLQYIAILSQLGQHQDAASMAQQAINNLAQMFSVSSIYVDQLNQNPQQSTNKSQKGQYIFEEVQFKTQLLTRSKKVLRIVHQFIHTELISQQEETLLLEASKYINNWKMNQANNQKQFRMLLQSTVSVEKRSLIGLLNENEWLNSFNIGTVMQIIPKQYDEVCLQGEILYEFSQKMLLQKVLMLSIAYFTLATETRFIEQEVTIATQTNRSQVYHLKAIYIACNIIPDNCSFIDHQIQSFQKHYNQNLITILEEPSFIDQNQSVRLGTSAKKQNTSINTSDNLKLLLEKLMKNKSVHKLIVGQPKQLSSLTSRGIKEESQLFRRLQTEPNIQGDLGVIKSRSLYQASPLNISQLLAKVKKF